MKKVFSVSDAPWFFIPVLIAWIVALAFAYEVPYGYEVLHLNAWRHEPFNAIFRFMTHLGEVYGFVVAGICLLFIRYRYALMIAVAGLLNIPIAYFLKDQAATLRPLTWLEQGGLIDQLVRVPGVELASGLTSFPSGHTIAAFTLFSLLALMSAQGNGRWGLLWAVLAILTGFSRIFLAQHFLADVLGGSVIGLLLGNLVWIFFRFRGDGTQMTRT
ncbi:MAG: phosphatase PAP2 family protein, partial [Bacteroidota bacterium]